MSNNNLITKRDRVIQILEQLKKLGDIEWQKKAWIKGEIFSAGFDEEITVLYDSYNFEDTFLKQLNDFSFSKDLTDSLLQLNDELNDYFELIVDYSDEEVINDPRWVALSSKILNTHLLLSKEVTKVPEAPLY